MTRSTNRRTEILDASAHLFARQGFDGVSVADIASSVGVTAPALYRHFADKEEILASVIAGTAETMLRIATTQRRDKTSLSDCVTAYTAEVLDHPDPAVTYLRERHRLRGKHLRDRHAGERELFEVLVRLYASACPDLDRTAMLHRLVGAVGALRGYAERGVRMARPAGDALVAEAVLALLTAPAATGPDLILGATVSPGVGWTPAPSPRERILRAALPLFRAWGFAGTAIGEIGEAAGVGATNVGRYFDSKEQILVDVYDRVGAQVEVGLARAVREATDATDALERMLHAYCAIAFEAADLVVVVSDNRGAIPADERPRLRRRDRRVMDLWHAVIAEARPELRRVEVDTLVTGVLPIMNMYPQQLSGALPAPAEVVSLVEAFLRGGAQAAPMRGCADRRHLPM